MQRPKERHKTADAAQDCPCGSAQAYGACCGIFHQGLAAQPPVPAPTPEALMRSRYSAYVLGQAAYLLATWHGSTAPGDLEPSPLKWLGLEVKASLQEGDAGVVEFVARYRDPMQGGRAGRLHEISRFVREGEGAQARWYYVDGQTPDH